MLENIKLILDLENNESDNLISLYINKVESLVMGYCNITVLDLALESFIEDKVVSIMKHRTNNIKSISRGDTKIEYNVGEAIQTSSNGVNLTDSDKKILNTYRKVRCF